MAADRAEIWPAPKVIGVKFCRVAPPKTAGNRGNLSIFAKFEAKQDEMPRPERNRGEVCPALMVIGETFYPVFYNRGDVFRSDYALDRALIACRNTYISSN